MSEPLEIDESWCCCDVMRMRECPIHGEFAKCLTCESWGHCGEHSGRAPARRETETDPTPEETENDG